MSSPKFIPLEERVPILVCEGWHGVLRRSLEILLGLPLSNVPTCGVICADFDLDDWSRIGKTKGREVFYDYPKNPQG